MTAPSSGGLLHAAETLLKPGPGPISEESLRRAVSTAYYAMYSAACDEVARRWEGEAWVAARRLLRHHAARDVCSLLKEQKRVVWLKDRPVCHADLLGFAQRFVELIDAREDADYAGDYDVTEDEAWEAVREARTGIEHLDRARLAAPEQVNAAWVAMIAGPAERRRMVR